MPLNVCVCHGGDNGLDGDRLLGADVRDIEIRSRFWDWGCKLRMEGDALYVRNFRIEHEGWCGAPNWANAMYRMRIPAIYKLILVLQSVKKGGSYIYECESAECRFFELFNSRAKIRRSDLLAAIMTPEELEARKVARAAKAEAR